MEKPQPFIFSRLIFMLPVILWACNTAETYSIKAETIKVDSLSQIVPLSGPLVKPLLYTHVSGLTHLPVGEAKKKFVDVVLPAILVAKHEIATLKIQIEALSEKKRWKDADSILYRSAKDRYKASDVQDLLHRIGTMPNSIVLAQAAVESGWGRSRFFLEGNNLFGVWSFNENEPRIAAGISRQDKTIYIRTYANISESLVDYFEVLGSAPAYADLRDARKTEVSPFELLQYLERYSERRKAYTELLKELILQNHFTRYDQYKIDPEFLARD